MLPIIRFIAVASLLAATFALPAAAGATEPCYADPAQDETLTLPTGRNYLRLDVDTLDVGVWAESNGEDSLQTEECLAYGAWFFDPDTRFEALA